MPMLHSSIFLFALLAPLVACSSSPDETAATSDDAITLGVPANLVRVPLVRQRQDYSCGDAATLAVLRRWKHADYKDVSESALYEPLHTSKEEGTDPQPIADYVNGIDGLHADYRTADDGVAIADLEAAVDRGEPPIVDIQAWQDVRTLADLKPWDTDWDDGHYVVLVGYDQRSFFFMDPSTSGKYAFIPRAELEERWHDVVGPTNVHTQRMAIFISATADAWEPEGTAPPRASPIH
jgi:predicted double-glycine peptidase